MKRLLPLVLIVVLAACNQAADDGGTDQSAVTGAGAVATTATAGDAGNALDSQGPKAQVYQFGIYKAVQKGTVKESSETNTGKVVSNVTLEHVKTTDHIPLVKDTYFGYQFRLFKLPPEVMVKPVMELRKVLIHPEMTLPDGSKTTGWDRTFKGKVETQQVMALDGYGFNEDYELVEGEWIFQIWYQDQKLLERKFVTVPPEPETTAESAPKE
jgi:hypothetical protein